MASGIGTEELKLIVTAETGQIVSKLDEIAQKIQRNAAEGRKAANDSASDSRKMADGLDRLSQGWDKANRFAGQFMNVIRGGAIAGAVIGVAKSIDSFVESADRMQGVSNAFGKSGIALDAVSESTRNAIGNFELMQAANKLVLSGVQLTSQQFAAMAEGARSVAEATGGSAVDGLNSFIRAATSGNAKALEQVGISFDQKAAVDDYARSLGKASSELSESEKSQAVFNAAIQRASGLSSSLGEDTFSLSGAYKDLKGSLSNTIDELMGLEVQAPKTASALQQVKAAAKKDETQSFIDGLLSATAEVEKELNKKSPLQTLKQQAREANALVEKLNDELRDMAEFRGDIGFRRVEAKRDAAAAAAAAADLAIIQSDTQAPARVRSRSTGARREQGTATAEGVLGVFGASMGVAGSAIGQAAGAVPGLGAFRGGEQPTLEKNRERLAESGFSEEQIALAEKSGELSEQRIAQMERESIQTEILTSARMALSSAIEGQVKSSILEGKISSKVFKDILANELASIAARSTVRAIEQTAIGTAMLVTGNTAAASLAFQSAGLFAATAVAAGVGARAFVSGGGKSGGSIKQSNDDFGRGFNQNPEVRGGPTNRSVTVNVYAGATLASKKEVGAYVAQALSIANESGHAPAKDASAGI